LFAAKVSALVVLAAVVGGGADTAPLVLHPTSSVSARGYGRLVADGMRAAAAGGCTILLWKAGTRKATSLGACRGSRALEGWSLDELALAGSRLAWMREESISHGMRVQTELVVKTGAAKPRQIASAYNDSGFGGWLLSLDGGGDTLAFGWQYAFDENDEDHVYRIAKTGGAGPCPFEEGSLLPNPPQTTFCADTGLPGGLVRGVSGRRILVTFGGFRLISVVQPDDSVVDLAIPPSQKHLELGISGRDVVVLQAGGSKLDVYDAMTGSLRRSWPVGRIGTVTALSVDGGFAVFRAKGTHLVRLSDGRQRMLLAPGRRPPLATSLTRTGLFVLYRTKQGRRLGFVPLGKLFRGG
jgi:hypothetical protein